MVPPLPYTGDLSVGVKEVLLYHLRKILGLECCELRPKEGHFLYSKILNIVDTENEQLVVLYSAFMYLTHNPNQPVCTSIKLSSHPLDGTTQVESEP